MHENKSFAIEDFIRIAANLPVAYNQAEQLKEWDYFSHAYAQKVERRENDAIIYISPLIWENNRGLYLFLCCITFTKVNDEEFNSIVNFFNARQDKDFYSSVGLFDTQKDKGLEVSLAYISAEKSSHNMKIKIKSELYSDSLEFNCSEVIVNHFVLNNLNPSLIDKELTPKMADLYQKYSQHLT
jgi:hypothetical protein